MSNISRSPNENIPMENNRESRPVRAKDPRMSHRDYVTRPNVQNIIQGQQIIQEAVEAPQRRDPDLMDISDDEGGDNGTRNNVATTSISNQQPRPPQISFSAENSAFGRNILRSTRLSNRPRGGRTSFPMLDMDEPVFGISIHALPTPELTIPFVLTSTPLQPPPPPPLLPQDIIQPELPAAPIRHSTSRISSSLIPSPRASIDQPNSSSVTQFMSPTEAQSSSTLSNPNYFDNLLHTNSSTGLEAAHHHFGNSVFSRMYQDYKKISTTNESDKIIQTNLIKGLKFLINDRNALYDELKKRDQDMTKMEAERKDMTSQIHKHKSTIEGLKGMKDQADKKAAEAEKEKEKLEEESKKLKSELVSKNILIEKQKAASDKLTRNNDKLNADNVQLKKQKEEAQEKHDREIQELKDKLKAETDAKAEMQEKLAEAEESEKDLSDKLKKSRAKKKDAETENTRIQNELEEVKKEVKKKDSQITKLELDQKVLFARSAKELKESKDEADKKIKELEDKMKTHEKELEDAKQEAKAAGKAEAKAEMQPSVDKTNRKTTALNTLLNDTNIASILSKKRKVRLRPAAVSHTVSDAGPSAAKRPRLELDSESSARGRPHSNPPPVAIISTEPISDATRSGTTTTASVSSGVTLPSNNGINNLMQQPGTNPPPSALINRPSALITPPPPIVPAPMNGQSFNPLIAANQAGSYTHVPAINRQQIPMMNAPNHIPYQRLPQMQNAPFYGQIPATPVDLVNRVGEILQQYYFVTDLSAEREFRNMDPYTQKTLQMYAEQRINLGHVNDVNPLIGMLMNSQLQQRQQQQLLQQQQLQQQHLLQQQQQIRLTRPQPPPQQQHDRRQYGHRSHNGASSNQTSRKRNADVPQAVPNQVNINQSAQHQHIPPQLQQGRHQQQQPSQQHLQQSIRHAFQPQPFPQRPTPPAQSPVVSTPQSTPSIPAPVNGPPPPRTITSNTAANSSPLLTQTLNRRQSAANNDESVDILNLLEMCRPTHREVNGYVRRRFNTPVGDSSYNQDPQRLDESFRNSYRYVTRR